MSLVLAAIGRSQIADYVATLFYVYGLILLAYIITSLVFSLGGRIPYSRTTTAILGFLRDVSEPYLRPFRRVIPQFGGFDFSPILAFFVLQIVGNIVTGLIRG
jgi:YggT family protein